MMDSILKAWNEKKQAFVLPRKKHIYEMICKNCKSSFKTTSNRAVMCSLKCKQEFVLSNIRCDNHGDLKEGRYIILNMDTSPHVYCYNCHDERHRTPEKKKIENEKKKQANAINKERYLLPNRKRSKEKRESLSNAYVAQIIRKKDKIPIGLIPNDLIEAKRLDLILKRLIEEISGSNWRSVK